MVDTACEIHQRHLVQLHLRAQILEGKIRRDAAGIAFLREAIQQEEEVITRLKKEGGEALCAGR